jgi:hypothetical protein
MLCVNQRERWTAKQLLQHPWILTDSEVLATKDLTESIATMKKFNAKRRLKAAADAVIMANRLRQHSGLNLSVSNMEVSRTDEDVGANNASTTPEIAQKASETAENNDKTEKTA